MSEDHFIPGIYNYCDRWCERCSLRDRCRVYADEAEWEAKNPGATDEYLWKHVGENLQIACDLIDRHLRKQGTDPVAFHREAMAEDYHPPELTPEQKALSALTMDYVKTMDEWHKEMKALLELKEAEINQQLRLGLDVRPEAGRLSDALEVVHFYHFFIAAKTQRALQGLQDDRKDHVWDDPVQRDANGSAKIALIAARRSLGAWEIIRQSFPERTDAFLPLLLLLDRIQKGILARFPRVMDFVRPGFDEHGPDH